MSELDTGPTPENTPLPGGGSWTWDDILQAWVPSTPQPE